MGNAGIQKLQLNSTGLGDEVTYNFFCLFPINLNLGTHNPDIVPNFIVGKWHISLPVISFYAGSKGYCRYAKKEFISTYP